MKRLFIIVMLLTVVVFILLITSQPKTTTPVMSLDLTQERSLAPDFELSDLNGNRVSLSSLRGKVVLVNFWATWCPPCREEIPSMDRLYQLLKGEDVVLLAINVEADGPQVVPKFMERVAFSFPVLFDVDGSVRGKFGVSKYPETFIVDADGVIQRHVIGAMDWTRPQMITYLRSLRTAEVALVE